MTIAFFSCAVIGLEGCNGFIGGIQAGYNYQMGAFVLGVETDIDWTSASADYTNPASIPTTIRRAPSTRSARCARASVSRLTARSSTPPAVSPMAA